VELTNTRPDWLERMAALNAGSQKRY